MAVDGKYYFYVRNLQNDIIGLVDEDGRTVGNYSYDSWGRYRKGEHKLMYHIWTIESWRKNIDLTREGHRTGLRLRFDKDVDCEVRRACKEFCVFLRKEYFFPLRIVVYIKNKPKLIAMDGDKCYGAFWSMEEDYTTEPHIRIAAGDYHDLCAKWGKDSALTAILITIAHELTHYFQWINSLKLTPIGMERQATKYAGYILDDYAETREHP